MKTIRSSARDILFFICFGFFTGEQSFAVGLARSIQNVKNIDELLSLYRESLEDPSLSENQIVKMAKEDWSSFAQVQKEVIEKGESLKTLPFDRVLHNETEYRLYGYTHGKFFIGLTMPKSYREFIIGAYELEKLLTPYVFFEQNLRPDVVYPDFSDAVDMQDHVVNELYYDNHVSNEDQEDEEVDFSQISFLQEALIGFILPWVCFPEFCFLEALHVGVSYPISDTLDYIPIFSKFRESIFNWKSDSFSSDLSNGFDNKLPSHLELELPFRSNVTKTLEDLREDTSRCALRSLYMSGFLKAFSESSKFKELPVFMGRGHLPELKGFLSNEVLLDMVKSDEAYKAGQIYGHALGSEIRKAEDRGDQEKVKELVRESGYTSTVYDVFIDGVTRLASFSPGYYFGYFLNRALVSYFVYYKLRPFYLYYMFPMDYIVWEMGLNSVEHLKELFEDFGNLESSEIHMAEILKDDSIQTISSILSHNYFLDIFTEENSSKAKKLFKLLYDFNFFSYRQKHLQEMQQR